MMILKASELPCSGPFETILMALIKMEFFYVQVTDLSGAKSGEFTDLSKVEKFEISDDAYEKRAGNLNMTSKFCL